MDDADKRIGSVLANHFDKAGGVMIYAENGDITYELDPSERALVTTFLRCRDDESEPFECPAPITCQFPKCDCGEDVMTNKEHGEFIDIVFDGPPGHEAGRFVEVEDHLGRGVAFGEWIDRGDGYWVLRIARHPGAGFELRKLAVVNRLEEAATDVLHHLEAVYRARDPKWDGSSTPDSLLGKLATALGRERAAKPCLRSVLREYLEADEAVQKSYGNRDEHDRALNRLIEAQKLARATLGLTGGSGETAA